MFNNQSNYCIFAIHNLSSYVLYMVRQDDIQSKYILLIHKTIQSCNYCRNFSKYKINK